MDAFELIARKYFERNNYWTRIGYRLDLKRLSASERSTIVKKSDPRPEIDLVAFKPEDNQLLLIECKSFLDSSGVDDFSFEPRDRNASRYKLFTMPERTECLMRAIVSQLKNDGLLPDSKIEVKLVLFAGKAASKREEALQARFQKNGWQLILPERIIEFFQQLSEDRYDNDIISMTSKILLRPKSQRRNKVNAK
jgi:hypothetical protein